MLGLEPVNLLPFCVLSLTEQPVNQAVAVAVVVFKNCLLFILSSRKKVHVRQPPDTISGVITEVILLYHVKLRYDKATYDCMAYFLRQLQKVQSFFVFLTFLNV